MKVSQKRVTFYRLHLRFSLVYFQQSASRCPCSEIFLSGSLAAVKLNKMTIVIIPPWRRVWGICNVYKQVQDYGWKKPEWIEYPHRPNFMTQYRNQRTLFGDCAWVGTLNQIWQLQVESQWSPSSWFCLSSVYEPFQRSYSDEVHFVFHGLEFNTGQVLKLR